MVTPVPIPNTEVKHFRGENSYACHSEGSSLPGSLVPLIGNLFLILSYEQDRDKLMKEIMEFAEVSRFLTKVNEGGKTMPSIDELEVYAQENHVPIMMKTGIEFILELIRNQAYTCILELGTAIGYSAIRMAKLSPQIRIDTLENDPERAQLALANIAAQQLEAQIHVHALDIALFQTDQQYDLIFVDAAKAQYPRYLEQFRANLADGGVFVFDNLNFHGMVEDPSLTENKGTRQMIKKLRRFREMLTTHPDYLTQFYPEVGDGVAVVSLLRK